MRGWPDVAAIADELVDVMSLRAHSELAERSRLASAAAEGGSHRRRARAVPRRRARHPRTQADEATLHAIYAAACRAMSVEAKPMRLHTTSRCSEASCESANACSLTACWYVPSMSLTSLSESFWLNATSARRSTRAIARSPKRPEDAELHFLRAVALAEADSVAEAERGIRHASRCGRSTVDLGARPRQFLRTAALRAAARRADALLLGARSPEIHNALGLTLQA